MNNERILEIAYCIENQFEPDTRLFLLTGGGLWNSFIGKNGRWYSRKVSPYQKWINCLWEKATRFYLKEVLNQEKLERVKND